MPAEALPPEIAPLSLYQSISNLPLSRFIDVIVDNNLYALVISGTPDPAKLTQAWHDILQEYSAAIGSGEYKVYVSLYREVEGLKLDLREIHSLVDSMRVIQDYIFVHDFNCQVEVFDYQKALGNALNSLLKTNCKFNNKDHATYQEELNKCIRRSAGIKIKLDLKLMAFEAIEKKNKGGNIMDRAYFDSMLITISDHAKYEITENITVSKYCERIKRFNQYCESLKSRR